MTLRVYIKNYLTNKFKVAYIMPNVLLNYFLNLTKRYKSGLKKFFLLKESQIKISTVFVVLNLMKYKIKS